MTTLEIQMPDFPIIQSQALAAFICLSLQIDETSIVFQLEGFQFKDPRITTHSLEGWTTLYRTYQGSVYDFNVLCRALGSALRSYRKQILKKEKT